MAKYLVKSGDSLAKLAGGDHHRLELLIACNAGHRNIKNRSRDDEYFGWLSVGECIEIPWQRVPDPECQAKTLLPRAKSDGGDASLDGPGSCRNCAIHVVVKDLTTGNPIAGAEVELSPGALTATTAADGTAAFQCLLDRTYAITATATGYKEKIVTAPSRCDGKVELVTISLEKEETLLVTRVEGPGEAVFSDSVTYTATAYNRTEVSAQDKRRVKWKREFLSVAADGTTTVVRSDAADGNTGEKYSFQVPRNCSEDWDAMRIYAYVEKPIEPVSVRTDVWCLPAPIAVSNLADVFDPARQEAVERKDALYQVDGCILVALFRNPTRMTPFLRTREELFTDTVEREARKERHCVVVNGILYDVTYLGKADAYKGHDPVPADETTPEGLILAGGISLGGQAASDMFFMRESGGVYDTGFGDLPPGSSSGFGGAGPLIIDSLPYNSTNVYASNVPAGAPSSGPPGPKYEPYLRERSNNTFKYWMEKLPGTVGKAILAYRSSDGALAVIVQPHGGCAMSIKGYRDALVKAGFSDAVFVDGSDSALFYARRRFLASPGEDKNETNTMGIGIRCR